MVDKKTIFFGPFIGEFGWELLYWHGWIRKVCKQYFYEYKKIVSSFPGRQPFYPDMDEFWPLPDDFLELKFSSRNYMTDYWVNGYPRPNSVERRKRFGIFKYEKWSESSYNGENDVEPAAIKLVNEFKSKLPNNTRMFVPFKWNNFKEQNLNFGVKYLKNPNSSSDFEIEKIPWERQDFDYLYPTSKGQNKLHILRTDTRPIISIFPRGRPNRRPDKNWSKEKYDDLIFLIHNELPDYQVAILGEPGGAYYEGEVPSGCLDLINIDNNVRMDVQIAVLKKSVVALGSISGAILVSLASGCPSLTWGWVNLMENYHMENILKTPFIYFPRMDASVEDIFKFLKGMIKEEIPPSKHYMWDPSSFLGKSSIGQVQKVL